eukprot:jgi/Psemu1/301446/fgenesh1_kg.34_\
MTRLHATRLSVIGNDKMVYPTPKHRSGCEDDRTSCQRKETNGTSDFTAMFKLSFFSRSN